MPNQNRRFEDCIKIVRLADGRAACLVEGPWKPRKSDGWWDTCLWLSRTGQWVRQTELRSLTGTSYRWEVIDDDKAAGWFVNNMYPLPDSLIGEIV